MARKISMGTAENSRRYFQPNVGITSKAKHTSRMVPRAQKNCSMQAMLMMIMMMMMMVSSIISIITIIMIRSSIPGGPKNGTVNFLGLCSDQQLTFFTLLDRASFPHYNNTKIIKFGWELFILWAISYGLSFSGFAINLSLIVPRNSGNRTNPENDSP